MTSLRYDNTDQPINVHFGNNNGTSLILITTVHAVDEATLASDDLDRMAAGIKGFVSVQRGRWTTRDLVYNIEVTFQILPHCVPEVLHLAEKLPGFEGIKIPSGFDLLVTLRVGTVSSTHCPRPDDALAVVQSASLAVIQSTSPPAAIEDLSDSQMLAPLTSVQSPSSAAVQSAPSPVATAEPSGYTTAAPSLAAAMVQLATRREAVAVAGMSASMMMSDDPPRVPSPSNRSDKQWLKIISSLPGKLCKVDASDWTHLSVGYAGRDRLPASIPFVPLRSIFDPPRKARTNFVARVCNIEKLKTTDASPFWLLLVRSEPNQHPIEFKIFPELCSYQDGSILDGLAVKDVVLVVNARIHRRGFYCRDYSRLFVAKDRAAGLNLCWEANIDLDDEQEA